MTKISRLWLCLFWVLSNVKPLLKALLKKAIRRENSRLSSLVAVNTRVLIVALYVTLAPLCRWSSWEWQPCAGASLHGLWQSTGLSGIDLDRSICTTKLAHITNQRLICLCGELIVKHWPEHHSLLVSNNYVSWFKLRPVSFQVLACLPVLEEVTDWSATVQHFLKDCKALSLAAPFLLPK